MELFIINFFNIKVNSYEFTSRVHRAPTSLRRLASLTTMYMVTITILKLSNIKMLIEQDLLMIEDPLSDIVSPLVIT